MTDPRGLVDAIRLRGLMRAVAHTETLPAASLSAGTDTAAAVSFTTGPRNADGWVIVTRISAQGIKPSNLTITARDLNRSNFALQLSPNLIVEDVPLIGDSGRGITVTLRNNAGSAVPVLFHIASLTDRQMAEVLGLPVSDNVRSALIGM